MPNSLSEFFSRPQLQQQPNPEPQGFDLLRDMLMRRAFQLNANPYGLSPAGQGNVNMMARNRQFDPYGGSMRARGGMGQVWDGRGQMRQPGFGGSMGMMGMGRRRRRPGMSPGMFGGMGIGGGQGWSPGMAGRGNEMSQMLMRSMGQQSGAKPQQGRGGGLSGMLGGGMMGGINKSKTPMPSLGAAGGPDLSGLLAQLSNMRETRTTMPQGQEYFTPQPPESPEIQYDGYRYDGAAPYSQGGNVYNADGTMTLADGTVVGTPGAADINPATHVGTPEGYWADQRGNPNSWATIGAAHTRAQFGPSGEMIRVGTPQSTPSSPNSGLGMNWTNSPGGGFDTSMPFTPPVGMGGGKMSRSGALGSTLPGTGGSALPGLLSSLNATAKPGKTVAAGTGGMAEQRPGKPVAPGTGGIGEQKPAKPTKPPVI